ncbi:MAG: AtpZ/AtpI family protein [Chloroflexota bacterium]
MPSSTVFVYLGQLTGIGWYIAAAILLPTVLGRWLDRQLGTAPVLLLVGLVLGLVLAGYGAVRLVGSLTKRGD